MEILIIISGIVAVMLSLDSYFKTRDIHNPVLLSAIFFVLPLLFNFLKLSKLQSKYWLQETYFVIFLYVIVFIYIPYLMIVPFTGSLRNSSELYLKKIKLGQKSAILMLCATILMQVYFNKQISGYSFPAFHLLELKMKGIDPHIAVASFVTIFIKTLSAVFILVSYLIYKKNKNLLLLLLIIIAILMPLSRFARFDILRYVSLVFLIEFHINKKKIGNIIKKISFIVIMIIFGIYLGAYRWSHGGRYNVSIVKNIQYKGDPGLLNSYAYLYAYFPMSFDNIDRFIKKNGNSEMVLGAYTLQPVFMGIFKLHRMLDNYPDLNYFNKKRDPIIGAATVSTALPAFTMDFGLYFSFLPMLLYSLIGCFFYIKSRKSAIFQLLFIVYAFNYIVSSFQNVFIQVRWFYEIIFILMIMYAMRFTVSLKKE